jgi:guanylate kinase
VPEAGVPEAGVPEASVIVVVSGPGGVGKGTVVARLSELRPDIRVSRSWTTRQRRPGEPEEAYVFVDRAGFLERVSAEGFIEWTDFAGSGHLYGTPTLDHEEETDAGPVVLLEIDLDGARQVKERYPQAVVILLTVGSRKVQEERLRSRGDNEEDIARRLEVGRREMEEGVRIADHVVVNDDVDRSAREVAGIVDARLSRR